MRDIGRRALLLEAHHTTHIEGMRLALDQAEQLPAGNPVPEADPDDVQDIVDAVHEAMAMADALSGDDFDDDDGSIY